MRAPCVSALVVLLLGGIGAGALSAQDKPARKPNIVFILADDVGYGDFGFTGHPYAKTPTIDKLAKQSVFFKNFYVSGPVCSPSRTGLTTGRFPATFQKIPASHGFSGAITVTDLLKQMGYRTAHFGKWHIGPDQKMGTYGIDVIKEMRGERKEPRGRDAHITDAVIEFLRASKGKSEPFYVNVWYHTVHNPVNPPQPFVDRFKGLKVNIGDFQHTTADNLLELKKSGEDIDLGMRKHLGDLSHLDEQVARLLQVLDELGMADDTIIIFTSDNGPHGVGSAGIFRGAKHSLYDGGVHLPLLIRWPGHVQAGRVDGTSVLAGVDYLPTLAKIARAKIDASKFDGEDVSDIWLGKERPRSKDLFWRTFAPKNAPVMLRGSMKLHFVRKGAAELYDLSKDPGQRTNIAAQNPTVVRDLTAAVIRWQSTLPKTYVGSDSDKDD